MLLGLLAVLAACGRKNKRVYDFSKTQVSIQRMDLPVVERLRCCIDTDLDQYRLSWEPVKISAVPEWVSFVGYRVYLTTKSGIKPCDCYMPHVRGAHHLYVSRELQGRHGVVAALFLAHGQAIESLMSWPVEIG